MDHHKRVQTSEAFINSAFLAVSGGFQDAYTYFTRDGVFSNAQTGNVVLMSERFMNGEVKAGLHYLIPLTAFFLPASSYCLQHQFQIQPTIFILQMHIPDTSLQK